MSEQKQLILLGFGTLFASSVAAHLFHIITHLSNFAYLDFTLFVTTICFVLIAACEMRVRGQWARQAYWQEYLIFSVFVSLIVHLALSGSQKGDEVTRIIITSTRLLFVMLFAWIVSRKYSTSEYLIATTLVLSAIFLGLSGQRRLSVGFHELILFSIVVVIHGAAVNFAEEKFFRTRSCSAPEVIFHAGIIASVWAFVAVYLSGHLLHSWEYSIEHPEAFVFSGLFAIAAYIFFSLSLTIIKQFSCTVSEVVQTFQLICVGIISMFTSPFSFYSIVGLFALATTFWYGFSLNLHRRRLSSVPTPLTVPAGTTPSSASTSYHFVTDNMDDAELISVNAARELLASDDEDDEENGDGKENRT